MDARTKQSIEVEDRALAWWLDMRGSSMAQLQAEILAGLKQRRPEHLEIPGIDPVHLMDLHEAVCLHPAWNLAISRAMTRVSIRLAGPMCSERRRRMAPQVDLFGDAA